MPWSGHVMSGTVHLPCAKPENHDVSLRIGLWLAAQTQPIEAGGSRGIEITQHDVR